jgi:hypothetical protein
MVIDHMYLMWSTYNDLSRAANRFWTDPIAPEKQGFPTISLTRVAGRSAGFHLVSLPLTASEAIGVSQAPIDDKLLGLLDPYTSM